MDEILAEIIKDSWEAINNAILDGPHGSDCQTMQFSGAGPCTCWRYEIDKINTQMAFRYYQAMK